MYQYVKKSLPYLLFITFFLCFVSPSSATDGGNEENDRFGHFRSHDQQPIDSGSRHHFIQRWHQLNAKGNELQRTPTYNLLSGIRFAVTAFYNPGMAFGVLSPKLANYFMPYILRFLSPEDAAVFEGAFNQLYAHSLYQKITQYAVRYIGEITMGYAALLLLSFPNNKQESRYKNEIDAALYFFCELVGWHTADRFQSEASSIWQTFCLPSESGNTDPLLISAGKEPEKFSVALTESREEVLAANEDSLWQTLFNLSPKRNRETFFACAEEIPGQCPATIPEQCPAIPKAISKCKKLPLTCSQIVSMMGVYEGTILSNEKDTLEICEFYWPGLLDAWGKLCPDIVNTLKNSKKKGIPALFFFGEYHYHPWPGFLIIPQIAEFLRKDGYIRRFLREQPPLRDNNIMYTWLEKKMGVQIIDADIYRDDPIYHGELSEIKELENLGIDCQLIGGRREEGMSKQIEQTYCPDTQTMTFGLFGQNHPSALINNFTQKHFISQVYLFDSTWSADILHPNCPPKIHQRVNRMIEMNPTFSKLPVKIVKISPGKETRLLSLLRQRKITLYSLSREVAEQIMEKIYPLEAVTLAKKKIWYKNYVKSFLEELRIIGHNLPSEEALIQEGEKQGGWYITLFTLTKCHTATLLEGANNKQFNAAHYFMDLLKKTESSDGLFSQSLTPDEHVDIHAIMLGGNLLRPVAPST